MPTPVVVNLARPPEIPGRNPNRSHDCKPSGALASGLEHANTRRRPSVTASLYEPEGDCGQGSRPRNGAELSLHVGTMLRPKGSMLFNGRIVKEVPKGEEDPFLEMHAYRGEPF